MGPPNRLALVPDFLIRILHDGMVFSIQPFMKRSDAVPDSHRLLYTAAPVASTEQRIGATFVRHFDTNAEKGNPFTRGNRLHSIALGGPLILLLVFVTSTVFVQPTWAIHAFQIGIFALVVLSLLFPRRTRNADARSLVPQSLLPALVYLIPLWGILQVLLRTTASTFETREAVLHWGALAGVFFLVQIVGQTKSACQHLLDAFLGFATLMAILCLAELNSANGSVLWLFPTGYPEVFATFPSHNSYAQFVELALPIALWRVVRKGLRSWWYGLAGGLLYASVVGAASRVGTVVCTAELLAVLGIGLFKNRSRERRFPARATLTAAILIPAFASLFTAVVGWERVWQRLQENDPYIVRREYLLSTLHMAESRPLIGFGLGTFPEVYQQFAVKDFPFYANHAHNDWAEFAADGGVPFFLLVLTPFAAAIPLALRMPWGIGIPAILLHACVDFPFPRAAVSAWIFVLLGALYATQRREPEACSERISAANLAGEAQRQQGDALGRGSLRAAAREEAEALKR